MSTDFIARFGVRIQFSIKTLMAVLVVVGIGAGFLAEERVTVGCAAVFSFLSAIGIWILFYFGSKSLLETLVNAISRRSLAVIAKRFQFALALSFLIGWVIIALAVSNFVYLESAANARNFVSLGWILGPISALAVHVYRNRRKAVK